jgi:hypothetical protein
MPLKFSWFIHFCPRTKVFSFTHFYSQKSSPLRNLVQNVFRKYVSYQITIIFLDSSKKIIPNIEWISYEAYHWWLKNSSLTLKYLLACHSTIYSTISTKPSTSILSHSITIWIHLFTQLSNHYYHSYQQYLHPFCFISTINHRFNIIQLTI